jgi:hypothetical protein
MNYFDSNEADRLSNQLNARLHSLSGFETSQSQLSDLKWQTYQRLEMLPPQMVRSVPIFTFGLRQIWRGLLGLLVAELVDKEQQVDYLEHCLTAERRSSLRQFLTLIK